MRTGDHFTFRSRPPFPDPSQGDPETIRQSFVHTIETTEVCRGILQKLFSFPVAQPRPVLLAGSYGVGKTHLLRYIQSLIADPDLPAWQEMSDRLGRDLRPMRPLGTLFIDLPGDPATSIEEAILAATGPGDPGRTTAQETEATMANAARDLSARDVALLVLEGLSRRIDRCRESAQVTREVAAVRLTMGQFAQAGILAVLTGDEGHLRQTQHSSSVPPLAPIASHSDMLWISRSSVAEIFANELAVKDREQQEEIVAILARIAARLPESHLDRESFVNLYPVHPRTFDALFPVRGAIPSFSPLDYLAGTVKAWQERPEDRLLTLDDLFESLAPSLRREGAFRALVGSYEEMRRRCQSLFRGPMQSKCETLARGIAFTSIFEPEAWELRALVDALLLFDDTGMIPGYGLASALIERMIEAAGPHLSVNGSGVARRCRLREVSDSAASDSAAAGSHAGGSAAEVGASHSTDREETVVVEIPVAPSAGTQAAQQSSRDWFDRVMNALGSFPEAGGQQSALPEAFLTHAVWERIRGFESRLEAARSIETQVLEGKTGPHEAGARFAHVFGDDESYFTRWRAFSGELDAVLGWAPDLERVRAYTLGTCLTGAPDVDRLREDLRNRAGQPDRFFVAAERSSFEHTFEVFKERYVDAYARQHQLTCELPEAPDGKPPAIDTVGLRNIELLSRLPYVEQSPVLRARIWARKLQEGRCRLPVREILASRPRCLCGFNPAGGRLATDPVAQLNTAIGEGIEGLRIALRECGSLIIQELQRLGVASPDAQPIAALLSRGPVPPLTRESVELLGKVILANPAVFGRALRGKAQRR